MMIDFKALALKMADAAREADSSHSAAEEIETVLGAAFTAGLAEVTERAEIAEAYKECACSYDHPDDICLGHKKLFDRLAADRDRTIADLEANLNAKADWIDGTINDMVPMEQDLTEARSTIIEQGAKIAWLREALTPFADCAEQIAEDEDDEEWAKFRLLVKDFRAARQALYGS